MFSHKIPVLYMIIQSGPFARTVLLVLLVFSVVSWTIVITKFLQFLKLKSDLAKFMQEAGTWQEGACSWMEKAEHTAQNAPQRIMLMAANECKKTAAAAGAAKDQLGTQFSIIEGKLEQAVAREIETLDWGLTFLAVAASVSPFIGLLGTVWGIMHSFYAIGSMGSTSINIVAPGIAEALITTIFGLVVAIPCAVFYNLFTKQVRRTETRLIDLSTSLIADVKRMALAGMK